MVSWGRLMNGQAVTESAALVEVNRAPGVPLRPSALQWAIRVTRGCLLPPKKLEKFSLKSVEEIKYKRRNVQQVRAEIVS